MKIKHLLPLTIALTASAAIPLSAIAGNAVASPPVNVTIKPNNDFPLLMVNVKTNEWHTINPIVKVNGVGPDTQTISKTSSKPGLHNIQLDFKGSIKCTNNVSGINNDSGPVSINIEGTGPGHFNATIKTTTPYSVNTESCQFVKKIYAPRVAVI